MERIRQDTEGVVARAGEVDEGRGCCLESHSVLFNRQKG